MKQTLIALFLVVFTLFTTQAVFAASNTDISSTGLSDIVQADDDDDGEKKDKKEGEEEPDCE